MTESEFERRIPKPEELSKLPENSVATEQSSLGNEPGLSDSELAEQQKEKMVEALKMLIETDWFERVAKYIEQDLKAISELQKDIDNNKRTIQINEGKLNIILSSVIREYDIVNFTEFATSGTSKSRFSRTEPNWKTRLGALQADRPGAWWGGKIKKGFDYLLERTNFPQLSIATGNLQERVETDAATLKSKLDESISTLAILRSQRQLLFNQAVQIQVRYEKKLGAKPIGETAVEEVEEFMDNLFYNRFPEEVTSQMDNNIQDLWISLASTK